MQKFRTMFDSSCTVAVQVRATVESCKYTGVFNSLAGLLARSIGFIRIRKTHPSYDAHKMR